MQEAITFTALAQHLGIPSRSLRDLADRIGLLRWLDRTPQYARGRQRRRAYLLGEHAAEVLALWIHLRRNLGASPRSADSVALAHLSGQLNPDSCLAHFTKPPRWELVHRPPSRYRWEEAQDRVTAVIALGEALRSARAHLDSISEKAA